MAAGKLARQGDRSRRVGTNSRPRMREGGQYCVYFTCACMSTEGILFEMRRQKAQAAPADDGERCKWRRASHPPQCRRDLCRVGSGAIGGYQSNALLVEGFVGHD